MSQNKAVIAVSVITIAAASYLWFSNNSKESKYTLVAKWTKNFQNHPVTASMIVLVSVVIAIGALLAAIKVIVEFYHWIAL